jgi:hypothetical protein
VATARSFCIPENSQPVKEKFPQIMQFLAFVELGTNTLAGSVSKVEMD